MKLPTLERSLPRVILLTLQSHQRQLEGLFSYAYYVIRSLTTTNLLLNRGSTFTGELLDEKKVQQMPVMAEEEEVTGANSIEEELQMRELKIQEGN